MEGIQMQTFRILKNDYTSLLKRLKNFVTTNGRPLWTHQFKLLPP